MGPLDMAVSAFKRLLVRDSPDDRRRVPTTDATIHEIKATAQAALSWQHVLGLDGSSGDISHGVKATIRADKA